MLLLISKNVSSNFCLLRVFLGTFNTLNWVNSLVIRKYVSGWKLFLWHEQDGVWCLHSWIHSKYPVNYPWLCYKYQESQKKRPNVWCWSTWQLLSGGIWNGKFSCQVHFQVLESNNFVSWSTYLSQVPTPITLQFKFMSVKFHQPPSLKTLVLQKLRNWHNHVRSSCFTLHLFLWRNTWKYSIYFETFLQLISSRNQCSQLIGRPC